MLQITAQISIADSEIELHFIRSSGPGGQNVNKVATDFQTARWIVCDDEKKLTEFKRQFEANLAEDADGLLAYLAPSAWKLNYTMEQWPDVTFLKTREATASS